MSAMTHYTTSDLAYFYADLHRLPCLSPEEQHALLASTPPTASHLEQAARNRLVEGHLGLATHLAIRECPPARYASAFPNILAEVFLALVQTADRYSVQTGGEVSAYLTANAKWAVKRALSKQKLIFVSSDALSRARAHGTQETLYALQPESLDAWMNRWEADGLEELPIMQPITPSQAAPERDPALRAQVETWLSFLSAQEQAVVRLHYGLSEEDERAYGFTEIGRLLGVKPGTVEARLRSALLRLKALATGTATLTPRQGKLRVSGLFRYQPPTLTAEQEHTLMQTATRLREQGVPVSISRLHMASGLSYGHAQAFLSQHRDQFPRLDPTSLHPQRLAHVARVCAELEAQGERVSVERLAKAAHVRSATASEFLRARKKEVGV